METGTEQKATSRFIRIFYALAIIAAGAALGYFVYHNVAEGGRFPFKLGLDLAGGSHLVYEADVSTIDPTEVPALMDTLREVIERRINVFGVAEPTVQVEESSFVANEQSYRLVVELPGVTDVKAAEDEIGRTPLLEFKLVDTEALAAQQAVESIEANNTGSGKISNVTVNGKSADDPYIDTGLTGRYLASAQLEFAGQNNSRGAVSNEPIVALTFTEEGADLFEKITREHTGEQLAIFLDGEVLSSPRINETISGGKAVISGGFTPDEARALAENLNLGALPVPITLVSTQSIGSALGGEALHAGIYAGVVGFLVLALCMILWYRLPGIIAVVALVLYLIMMLALFQVIPVVLTAAGIAGLILSIGLAVDANILIAERIKEELREGKGATEAITEGFARAWLAIRDSNIAHLIAGVILFWFGTSLIKGFALVFVLGVFVSMLSAITISRTLLLAIPVRAETKVGRFLLGSGFFR
jgi:protein-export membrane protein SecD